MSEVGELLRGARHKRGVSLDEAALITRIKLPYLEALENGEYSLIPGSAYVTGFLRNYARYLGLHPEELVQEYNAQRPPPQPIVKAATRVLASGHERRNRTRLLWILAAVVVFIAGAYTIKQYNSSYAHADSSPLIVTPANLGSSMVQNQLRHIQPRVSLRLGAIAPVWIRVTVDGSRRFQGILRPKSGMHRWVGQRSIYAVTYDGSLLNVTYDKRYLGRMAHQPGLTVHLATLSGWKTAA